MDITLQDFLMKYGHIIILISTVAIIFGARIHIRFERNGTKFPKLRLQVWFEPPRNKTKEIDKDKDKDKEK